MTDADEFEAFVLRYADMVYATAVRLLGNEAEAEDVAQTVFLKAFERFGQLAASPAVGGWLKTVTTNACLNHLARHRRRFSLFSELASDVAGDDAPMSENDVLDSVASVSPFDVEAYRQERPPQDPRPVAYTSASADPAGASPVDASAALVTLPRASFTDRTLAFALDAILVGLAIALVDPLVDRAFVALFLAYRSAFWAWKGTTVGGIICQTRIVRVDGSPLGPGEALVRGLGSIFSVAVLGLGCLWMLRDADRQTWHDQMAGTYVVKVPRNWPL